MDAEMWTVDAAALVAIVAMGAVTFAARAGGFFIIKRVRVGPFLRAWMGHVPGAIFVALVAPAVVAGGPAVWLGSAVTALAAGRGLPLYVSLAGGVGTVALARTMGA